MTVSDLLELAQRGLILALTLSLPIVGATLAASLFSALLQALTKVSEPALTHVPRLIAVGLALFLTAPWISQQMVNFTEVVFSCIHAVR
jgi:flagellar biosynthetic protein FliQ